MSTLWYRTDVTLKMGMVRYTVYTYTCTWYRMVGEASGWYMRWYLYERTGGVRGDNGGAGQDADN